MKKVFAAPALATTLVLSEFPGFVERTELHHSWARVSVPVVQREMWHNHVETETGR